MLDYTALNNTRSGIPKSISNNLLDVDEIVKKDQGKPEITKENPAQTARTVGGVSEDLLDQQDNDITTTTKDALQEKSKTEMELVIEELNETHAFVMLGGKSLILNEEHNDISFSSIPDFKSRYLNRKVDGNSVAKLWLESPKRREYSKVDFCPGTEDPEIYNLFRGLAVKPKQGSWSLMGRHIFQVIAGENEELYRYILNWMADAVQKPGGLRSGVAIVLKGDQGTGKGIFANNFGKIFGPHYKHITSQKQITGNFNNHLKDALLVFCDEGYWAGDKQDEGNLKGLITEDQIMIEPKGRDAYSVENHIRLIMASNNDWVIPAGAGERRYFVLDVKDYRKGDHSYFRELADLMNNGGLEAMLYDLLNRDISKVNLREYPRTKALFDQFVNSLHPVGKFWYNCLVDGRIGNGGGGDFLSGSMCDDDKWPKEIKTDGLYNVYQESAKMSGGRHRVDKAALGRHLKQYCEFDKVRKTDGSKRNWYYIFPDLEDCRKQFEEKIGVTIDWEEE